MRKPAVLFTLALACIVLPAEGSVGADRGPRSARVARSATLSTVAGDVTVTTTKGRLKQAGLVPAPVAASDEFDYPVGFFGLRVDKLKKGATTALSFELPEGVEPDAVVRCAQAGCAVLDADLGAEGFTIHIKDGSGTDADGRRNGVVVLTVAPAVEPCALPAGEQVVHEWEGVVGTTVFGAPGAEHVESFALPDNCSYESLTVTIDWDAFVEDIDLEVTAPDATSTVSEDVNLVTGEPSETVMLNGPANGAYTARAYGFLNVETPYRGAATVNVAGTPLPSNDKDLDGVLDASDNCPAVFNPSQADAEGDGAGDACDEPATPLPPNAETQVFSEQGTSGITVQGPPPIIGPDLQGTGFSQGGALSHTYTSTLTNHYTDYSALRVRMDWEFEFKDYFVLEVRSPGGQILTGIFVNTNYQEVLFTDPVPGEYTITVRESRTTTGAFTVSGFATRTDQPVLPPLPPIASDPTRPRVIVADLDSAINPYHDFYYIGSEIHPDAHPSSVTQEVLDALGVPPENVVELTRTGNLAADVAADAAFWDNVERGELYHFRGTNLIATSLIAEDVVPLVPDPAKSPHGVGTSGAVLTANPDAVVVFVEVGENLASAESHALAFQHPAVDMVTTSYGLSIPETGFPLPEWRAFEHTYEGVVTNGKLHFSSGGNGPGLTPLRGGAGPWWSIGVSGIEEGSSEGDSALSGNFPDFVSDFTQDLPYCMDCEAGLEPVPGTSFSTPRAAGVASKVLLEARAALGHAGGIAAAPDAAPVMANGDGASVTNWQLRRALEQAAWVPDSLAYDPIAGVLDFVGLPINPVAPWLQVGWGDLTALPEKAVVSSALAELELGTGARREKGPGFCEFQTAVIEARKAYWNEIAPNLPDEPFGGEVPPGAPATDPFVYC